MCKLDVNKGSSKGNTALWSPIDKMMPSIHTQTDRLKGKTGALAYS